MDTEKIRADFPLYDKEEPPIFLDSACQTLRPRQVIDAVLEYYEEYPVCGGRSLYNMASKVTERCEEARDRFARFLRAKESKEIVFTKNTTEGVNTVIFGKHWNSGDEIVCSDREHNSVLAPLLKLAERKGVKIRRLRSLPDESFDLEGFRSLVTRRTKLVAMCHTSNITGYTIPAREIAEIAHDCGAELLLDAAQSAPHQSIDVGKIGADYLALSVHKMCGPSGVGALYGKLDLLERLEPLIYGGMTVSDTTYESIELLPSPHKFEAGLQNYAGIIGAGVAAQYIQGIGTEEITEHDRRLSRLLAERIEESEGILALPPQDPSAKGGIFSFNLDGYDPHDVAWILDSSKNILIRSGHHCCHSWFHSRNIDGCARASFYLYNDEREVDEFAAALKELSGGVDRQDTIDKGV